MPYSVPYDPHHRRFLVRLGANGLARALELPPMAAAAFPGATVASGGATAGKTTSIPRAKVRYYGRISTAVAAFDALALSVKEGDLKGPFAKAFFDESVDSPPDNESPYNAFKTAGYLLAVAFKIDSKIPPDKIPQVKDYKKFMKDLEKLKEAVGRGKVSDSQSAYASVKESLNVLLEVSSCHPSATRSIRRRRRVRLLQGCMHINGYHGAHGRLSRIAHVSRRETLHSEGGAFARHLIYAIPPLFV